MDLACRNCMIGSVHSRQHRMLDPCGCSRINCWHISNRITGKLGVKFIRQGNKWEWQDQHVDMTSFDFIRSSGWLQSILRNYANTFGFPLMAENHIPEGPTFRAWTRCICLTASPSSFLKIDEFRRRGVCNVRKIHAQLDGLGPFGVELP